MKKVLTLMMVAGMFSLVACGPSAEEKEAAEAKAEQVANDLMKGMDEATTEETETAEATTEEATTEEAEATTEEATTEEEAPAAEEATEEAPAE